MALGFSRPFAFVASLWLAFLLFPPFNFVYGLQGWLATSPLYGHTLALSNLLLIAFIKIGAEAGRGAGASAPARAQLAARELRSFVLVLLIVLAAPFYNGGMLIGTFLLAGVIFLSSQPVRQMLWRLAAGIYVWRVAPRCVSSNFSQARRPTSARFSGPERPLLHFHWPAEFSPELIASTPATDCAHGAWCAIA